jgi:hypothetical protein
MRLGGLVVDRVTMFDSVVAHAPLTVLIR